MFATLDNVRPIISPNPKSYRVSSLRTAYRG